MDSQSGFRLIRADLLRELSLTGTKYEIETEMLIKLVRNRIGARARADSAAAVRRRAQQDSSVPRHVPNVHVGAPLSLWQKMTRADSDLSAVRWHAGALNNGLVFGLTLGLVRALPRAWSYAIGHVGTWLAFRLMAGGTRALVENLRVVLPARPTRSCRGWRCSPIAATRRTRSTSFAAWGSIARRCCRRWASFDETRLDAALARGRGVILVGGHFGNWELGGIALRLLRPTPMAVVAKSEASPAVGAIRRRMREAFAIDTIEIGQTLETALQIRGRLAANGLVAMLLDRHNRPRSRRCRVLRTADAVSCARPP